VSMIAFIYRHPIIINTIIMFNNTLVQELRRKINN